MAKTRTERPLPFNRVVRCHDCEDWNVSYTYEQDARLLNSACTCCGSRDKSSMPIDMFRHRYGYTA